uniref:Peptidase A1 domain-containing protein n=1 Tax=Cucumis sativus TaxID=3659 RepID=A0A0A0L6V5_CUCSA
MLLILFSLSLFTLSFSQSNSLSLPFPLSLSEKPSNTIPSYSSQLYAKRPSSYGSFKLPFKYSSTALVVSLPIGTPPQPTDLVLDTGSQLSWIQCHDKKVKKRLPPLPKPKTASFDPSLSSSFSLLPCNHPICKPRIPDFTLPTSCDQNRLCHYSYFYADGTLAEGNLVREKFTFSKSLSTPPVILGCAQASTENRAAFKPDAGGSGQTMIDSGSDLTYLVDEAYEKVKEEVVRLVGAMMKKGYVYADVADMCFDAGVTAEVGRRIGGISFEFDNGVEIFVGRGEGVLTEVEKGVKCVGIGRSERLGIGSNIIGTVHQQNMWVEYDLANKRVGFGGAECSRLK